ncbi:MAG: methyltransferase domain-containing protein [Pseudomonadota bacterium]
MKFSSFLTQGLIGQLGKDRLKPMPSNLKKKIKSHGITVFLSSHPDIRRLKRRYSASFHGNKFWASSWLIMDFLKKQGLNEGIRVLEVGCGWGLAGVYCARMHKALVTAIDIDPEVFPYLHLHAAANKVEVKTMKRGFSGLRTRDLRAYDLILGADICFWDSMVNPLKNLINRALSAGVSAILLADPGRPPFQELGAHFSRKGRGEIMDWAVRRPRPIHGALLKIGSLPS